MPTLTLEQIDEHAKRTGVILPLHYTERRWPFSQGGRYVDFCNTFLTVTRGFKKTGDPLIMTGWQEWLMERVFETKPDGLWRYRQVLIGLPRKNGKSLLASTIVVRALFFGDRGAQIYSAAGTRDQASIVFREACLQVRTSALLRTRLRVYKDRIENFKTGAIYKPLAADANSTQGLGPLLVVVDEVHAIGDTFARDFWNAFTEASGDRPQAMVIGITTAGHNKDTLLGDLIKSGEDSLKEGSEENDFGYFWWGLPEDANIFDENLWKYANPNIPEGLYDMDNLRSSLRKAVRQGNVGKAMRFRFNMWTRSDGKESFLTESMWRKSLSAEQTRIEPGSEICLGFDGSISDDSTAFLAIDLKTGFLEILACWEKPDGAEPGEWMVPRDEVNAERRRIFAEYKVKKMFCDISFYQTDVMAWTKEVGGGIIERIPQSLSRMVPLAGQLKVDLLSGDASHGADERLQRHFLNAIVHENGKVSKEKGKSEHKIDFLVCAMLANGARNKLLGRHNNRPKKASGGSIVLK